MNMKKSRSVAVLGIAVTMALLFSLAVPLSARADGSTPATPTDSTQTSSSGSTNITQTPNTDTPVPIDSTTVAMQSTDVTPAPTDGTPFSTDTSTTDTPVATDATTTATQDSTTPIATQNMDATPVPTDDTPLPTDTSTTSTQVASTDTVSASTDTPTPEPTNALTQIPDGTQVVVLDSTGTPEPLATQAAANTIQNGDPIWCPTGQTPGDAGCTSAYSTVTDLVNNLGSYSGAGTVYFTSSYSTNDATFDQTNSNLTNLTALTIQGGWNGLLSSSYALSGVSTFNVPLSITNWTNDVTVNDITVNGASGDGLTVTTSGNIKLKNVHSSHNSGNGAVLDNHSGSGKIDVSASTFNHNGGDGLDAYSSGNITLANVIADYNTSGSGAVIKNDYQGSSGKIDVSAGTFNHNGDEGLDIYSNGNVTLANVIADYNTSDGEDAGLYIDALGVVTLSNVTASNNSAGDGADVFNFADLKISNSSFNNNSSTEDDYGWGLYVGTDNGAVNLTNVIADNNGYGGVFINAPSIAVLGGQFNNNGYQAPIDYCQGPICNYAWESSSGLWLENYGSGQTILKNVQANGNYGDGADLFGDNIYVANSTFNNNGKVGFDNLWDYCSGDITCINSGLSLFAANKLEIYADGLYTDYSSDASVTVKCSRANDNAAYGYEIYTDVATLKSATATGNGWGGTHISAGTVNKFSFPCGGGPFLSELRSILINCSNPKVFTLSLQDSDRVLFNLLCGYQTTLTEQPIASLPALIPNQYTFVSGLNVRVLDGSQNLDPLPRDASIVPSFQVPDPKADYTILYWNGGNWIEIPGGTLTNDGFFEVQTDYTGIFVLVQK